MNLGPASLRNRLVLGATAVGLAFAVIFGLVATWRINHAESQAIEAALQSRIELARDEVATDGSMTQDVGSPKTDLVQVIGPDGKVRASSRALTGVPPLVDLTALHASTSGVERRLALQHPDIDLAVLAVPLNLTGRTDGTGSADPAAAPGALVVAVDAEGFNAVSSQLLGLLMTGLGAVVLAFAGLSWVLTGHALASVTRIAEDAEAVKSGDLASGLPVPLRDAELARLVEALNRMLARLDHSHATELAFAADAGHRLRTPVATLRAEAELGLRETDPLEMRAALERVVQDADQLTSIVDRMLARNRSRTRTPEPVVTALTEACIRWGRQAELAQVSLSVSVDDAITAETTCVEIVEIVEPIVDNAVRHTPATGKVQISATLDDQDGGSLLVSISNTGDTIPPDLTSHLFDPWVSSRNASVAGGLGLWLARETARDGHGDVEFVAGTCPTTFRVRLPTANVR